MNTGTYLKNVDSDFGPAGDSDLSVLVRCRECPPGFADSIEVSTG